MGVVKLADYRHNNVLLKNVNHLPRLHFLFEENVDVDITEISAHQDKLLP